MQISWSSPVEPLSDEQKSRIEKDLEKIERRLNGRADQAVANVRVSEGERVHGYRVVLELDYGRHHLIAKEEHEDLNRAVRVARDDIIRQINDTTPKGHSWFKKRH